MADIYIKDYDTTVSFDDNVPMSEIQAALKKQFPAKTPIAAQPQADKSSVLRRAIADPLITGVKGLIGLPEGFVGLADIPTGGRVGKALESVGYEPKKARDILSTLYSPEQKEANRKVQAAKGFTETIGTALENPSTILHSVIESAPSMVGGGGMARGLLKVAPKIGAVAAGAAGEGLITAGQNAEQVREESKTGLLTAKQSGLMLLSGMLTGAISGASGGISKWLGIADVDRMMATGATSTLTGKAAQKGIARKIGESALTEGGLEEPLQSWQEQVFQNISQGKPWDEGASNAAAMGMLTGTAMGMGGGGVEHALERGSSKTADADASKIINDSASSGSLQDIGDETLSEALKTATELQVANPKDKYLSTAVETLTAEAEARKARQSEILPEDTFSTEQDALAAQTGADRTYNNEPISQPAAVADQAISQPIEAQAAPDYASLINAHAEQSSLDPSLLSAVAQADGGLMQLQPEVARAVGIQDATDPNQNLSGGSRYLAALMQKYQGDETKALAALKWGALNVDMYGIEKAPNEVKNYISAVQNISPAGMIASGLRTGQVNGQPFGPNEALSVIQRKVDEGAWGNDELNQMRENHPALSDSLNGMIAENLTAKISQTVGIAPLAQNLDQGLVQGTDMAPIEPTAGIQTPPAPLSETDAATVVVADDAKSGGSLNQAPMQGDQLSYEEFSRQYRDAFNQGNKYTPKQVGSRTYTDMMATLADKYPEHLARLEAEEDQKTSVAPSPPEIVAPAPSSQAGAQTQAGSGIAGSASSFTDVNVNQGDILTINGRDGKPIYQVEVTKADPTKRFHEVKITNVLDQHPADKEVADHFLDREKGGTIQLVDADLKYIGFQGKANRPTAETATPTETQTAQPNDTVSWTRGKQTFTGKVQSIDKAGKLKIAGDNGKAYSFKPEKVPGFRVVEAAKQPIVMPTGKKQQKEAHAVIGRIIQLGGMAVKGDYSRKELAEYPDLRRNGVMNRKGMSPDDMASILNDEGYNVGSGDELIELLKSGRAREVYNPVMADQLMEAKLDEAERKHIAEQLANLREEGIDAGRTEESRGEIEADLLGEIEEEGYPSEAEAELNAFFENVGKAIADTTTTSEKPRGDVQAEIPGTSEAENFTLDNPTTEFGTLKPKDNLSKTEDMFSEKAETPIKEATRSKPVETIQFENPVVGKNGAKLVAYEWKWEPYEYVDDTGEERVKRISNWSESVSSEQTGRDIVHQFHVENPDGSVSVVSAESVARVLGLVDESDKKILQSSISAVKTIAKLKVLKAKQEQRVALVKSVSNEVALLSLPPIVKDKNGFSMGDEHVWQKGDAITEERRNTLIDAWRQARVRERFGNPKFGGPYLELEKRKLSEIEGRLEKQEKKLSNIVSKPAEADKAASIARRMDGSVREKKQSPEPLAGFDALPQMTRDKFNDAFNSKNVELLQEYLDTPNKNLRAEFEKRTGIKLPKGVSATDAAVAGWAETASQQLPETAKTAENVSTQEKKAPEAEPKKTATSAEEKATVRESGTVEKTGEDEKGKTEAGNISDFGEKIGGAKKDRVQSLEKKYTDDDIVKLPLSKIWPKSEVDAIEDKFIAAYAYAARAEIPTKPQKGYKLARWVETVKTFRELMQNTFSMIESGKYDREAILEKAKASRLEGFFAKVRLLEGIDREQWDRIGKVSEHPDAYKYADTKIGANFDKIPAPFVSVEIDGRYNSFYGDKTVEEALDKIKAALDKEQATTADAIKSFEVRGHGDSYFINKKGDSQYHKLKEFKTSEEAFAFRKEHSDELLKAWDAVKELENVSKEDVRRKENRPRTGKDYRGGKDVTPQQFSDTFGFRGVEFGNWVSQGKNTKERQGMLNDAYDALMDLAGIIDVPPKAISLNGELGLGFGSRGSGSSSAHYEPDKIVINLTKTRGSGTLAHEFFHALDNYFQRQRGATGASRESRYITYNPTAYYQEKTTGHRLSEERYDRIQSQRGIRNPGNWERVEGVRPEVAEAFKNLVDVLDESPMAARARKIKNDYWSRIIERAARSFENYVIVKMNKEGYQNDYLANVAAIDEFKRDNGRYPYLFDSEIAPVEKAFDDLFNTIQARETDKGVAMYSRKAKEQDVAYLNAAESGDMETAQMMVAEAAKKAGYTEKVYHGGRQFNQFNADQIGTGSGVKSGYFWLTSSKENAESFEDGETKSLWLNPDEVKEVQLQKGESPRMAFDRAGMEAYENDEDTPSAFVARDIVDGATHSDIYGIAPNEDGTMTAAKSADPVTYDDRGNIIPLSERFNEKSPDIRYASAPRTTGTNAADLAPLVKSVTTHLKNAATVKVVQSESEFPNMVQREIRADKAEGTIAGLYYDGTIYLVGDNLSSRNHALLTLAHELFHDGFSKRFTDIAKNNPAFASYSKQMNNLLWQVWKAHQEEIIATVGKTHTHLNFAKITDRVRAAEEWLANQSPKSQPRWYDRLVAIVHNFLRRISPNLKISDAEVRTLIEDVRKTLTGSADSRLKIAGNLRYMVAAWHGSPHTFDKFDTGKIGTGEGAQAYGHGLYFSGKKEVAEYYKETLAERNRPDSPPIKNWDFAEEIALDYADFGKNNMLNRIEEGKYDYAFASEKDRQIAIEWVKNDNKGRLYEVELAPDEDEFLLWDKPLSEQSEKVKKAWSNIQPEDVGLQIVKRENTYTVQDALGYVYKEGAEDIEELRDWWLVRPRGEMMYEVLERALRSDKAASDYLHSLGIRGIKYLDGTSRGKGDGGYNYVIFSDKDVNIKVRYQVSAWHGGSDLEGGKFDIGRNRHDQGRGQFGYGLYFSDLDEIGKKYAEEAAKDKGSNERHLYRVTLHKGKEAGQYDFLNWQEPLSDKQATKLNQYLIENHANDSRFSDLRGIISAKLPGNMVYKVLSSAIGGDRQASAFLLDAGIDGVRYSADAIYGTNTGATNYVVFDENAVTVEEHIKYSKREGNNSGINEPMSKTPGKADITPKTSPESGGGKVVEFKAPTGERIFTGGLKIKVGDPILLGEVYAQIESIVSEDKYEGYALRIVDETHYGIPMVGDEVPEGYVWGEVDEDGEFQSDVNTGELSGTISGLVPNEEGLRIATRGRKKNGWLSGIYDGNFLVLAGGELAPHATWNTDEGEVVLQPWTEVLAVWYIDESPFEAEPWGENPVNLREITDYNPNPSRPPEVGGPKYSRTIKTPGGHNLIVDAIDHVETDNVVLNVRYGKASLSDAGSYQNGKIELARAGGKWTLHHESIHFMEDMGILNGNEVGMLQRHIRNLAERGKFEPVNQKDIGGAEDRANFLADALTKEPKGLLGRVIVKIQDFVNKLVNAFGVKTVKGITRDVKTGEIFDRKGLPKDIRNKGKTLRVWDEKLGEGKIKQELHDSIKKVILELADKYGANIDLIEPWESQKEWDYANPQDREFLKKYFGINEEELNEYEKAGRSLVATATTIYAYDSNSGQVRSDIKVAYKARPTDAYHELVHAVIKAKGYNLEYAEEEQVATLGAKEIDAGRGDNFFKQLDNTYGVNQAKGEEDDNKYSMPKPPVQIRSIEEIAAWLNEITTKPSEVQPDNRKKSKFSKDMLEAAIKLNILETGAEAEALGYDVDSGQQKMASDLIDRDYEQAKRVAFGEENPPGRVKEGTVALGVAIKAFVEGDTDTITKLARSKASLGLTEAAQTLAANRRDRMLAAMGLKYYENPVNAIADVEAALAAKVEKQTGKKATKEAIAKAEAAEKELAEKEKVIAEQAAEITRLNSQEHIDGLIKAYMAEKGVKETKIRKRAEYGSKNKVVTREAYEQSRKEWRSMFSSQLNAGIDPTALAILAKIGTYHFEAGVRKFAEWSAAVIEDTHPSVKPHLKATFEKVKTAFGQGLTDKIKKGVSKGRELGELQRYVDEMAKAFIEDGITDGNELVQAVYEELQPIIPDITLEETRDAISGYGKWKPLTHDELLDRYREIKQEQQLVAKLRDIQTAGTIEKTGVERQPMTQLARDLLKQVNNLKKKYGLNTTDPETQLSSALEAYKRRMENQIADLEKEIETKQKIVKEKYDLKLDTEAKALTAERDKKKAERDSIFGKPEMSDEQRLKLAVQAAKRSAAEYSRRIAEHDFSPLLKNGKALTNAELEQARKEQAIEKKAYQELRELEHPGEMALKALETRLSNEKNRLRQALANRDFTKKEKNPLELTPELKKLKEERDLLKQGVKAAAEAAGRLTDEDIRRIDKLASVVTELREAMDQGGDRLAYGSAVVAYKRYLEHLQGIDAPLGKVIKDRWEQAKATKRNEGTAKATREGLGDAIKTLSDTSVVMAGSWDNSFLGRQGLFTLLSWHGGIWGRAAVKSFLDIYHTMGGTNTMDALMADAYSRPNYLNGNYRKAGIIVDHEEQYPTALPERLPVLGRIFKASGAAFNGSALRMRMDLFDLSHQAAANCGANVGDEKLIEDFGKLAGDLTSRAFGGKGKDVKSRKHILQSLMDALLWAPKMLKAEYDILTVHSLGTGLNTSYAKREALKNTGKIFASITMVSAVATAIIALSGGDDDDQVSWNPFNPKFMQIPIGGKYFDHTAKLASLFSFIVRLIGGKTINSETGIEREYTGAFGETSIFQAFVDFMTNKTKPFLKMGIDFAKEKDFKGRKPTLATAIYGAYVPIPAQTAIEAGGSKAEARWAAVVADVLGVGSQDAQVWPTVWRPDQSVKLKKLYDRVGEERFKKLNKQYNEQVDNAVNRLRRLPSWKTMGNDKKEKLVEKARAQIKARYAGA